MPASEIKVIATPEAYEILQTATDEVLQPVKEAIKLALGKRERCTGHAGLLSSLGFWTRWSETDTEPSIIMIYKSGGLPPLMLDHVFEEELKTAIPIHIA